LVSFSLLNDLCCLACFLGDLCFLSGFPGRLSDWEIRLYNRNFFRNFFGCHGGYHIKVAKKANRTLNPTLARTEPPLCFIFMTRNGRRH